ncbi:MAG: hypothetical protein ACE5HT_07640 [Gemmatimonadales bacterium]
MSNTSGKSRIGALFVLVLLAAGVYYGINLGTIYVRYWRFQEAVKTEARQAPGITDGTIRRRLEARVKELGLPDAAYKIQIQRRERPREIVIKAAYQELLELPFVDRPHTFRIEVRHPL